MALRIQQRNSFKPAASDSGIWSVAFSNLDLDYHHQYNQPLLTAFLPYDFGSLHTDSGSGRDKRKDVEAIALNLFERRGLSAEEFEDIRQVLNQ